ncbi:hypothetical protein ACFW1P_32885 [Paenibacillus sp. NPDC058910]|uniref:hypothetical protein n=1 Tax=unclassified Paenibacillus TaxID=185978 RepID=UPI00368C7139
MYSLDIIIDKSNDYDKLLRYTADHFNINFYKQSNCYADAFNDEKKFIVSASPSKISFMLPESSDVGEFMVKIVPFLSDNFNDQTVGVRCIGKEDKIGKINVSNVRTVVIR